MPGIRKSPRLRIRWHWLRLTPNPIPCTPLSELGGRCVSAGAMRPKISPLAPQRTAALCVGIRPLVLWGAAYQALARLASPYVEAAAWHQHTRGPDWPNKEKRQELSKNSQITSHKTYVWRNGEDWVTWPQPYNLRQKLSEFEFRLPK